jgi:hypothetical protein
LTVPKPIFNEPVLSCASSPTATNPPRS